MKNFTPPSTHNSSAKRILFLGYDRSETRLIELLKLHNCEVDHCQAPITTLEGYDLAVSFGYRHIIQPRVLEQAACPVINLHISYLPFNKGAHPNFWSFYEGTPAGVSIHLIDEKIDTGQLLYQQKLSFDPQEHSFASTYQCLKDAIEALFEKHLAALLSKSYTPQTQPAFGTYHAQSELPDGIDWNDNIQDTTERLKSNAPKKAVLILSNLMDSDTAINEETQQRCLTALQYFDEHQCDYLITSGWIYDPRFSVSLCEATARFLQTHGVAEEHILLNRASRDTVGDAFFTRLHLLTRHNIQSLTVVTSDYHLARAQIIFNTLMPDKLTLNFVGCATEHAVDLEKERSSLALFNDTFAGVDKHNLEALLYTLVTKHSLYKAN
ncbi:MAG: hypothetical protein CMG93_05315 [Marinomonas sp.]|nr:hypothetical protein [Marinomonas sp.]